MLADAIAIFSPDLTWHCDFVRLGHTQVFVVVCNRAVLVGVI